MIEAERLIVIDRQRFRLSLYDDPERPDEGEYDRVAMYRIAVGAQFHNTPRGVFRVTSKSNAPTWTMPASDWVPQELWGTVIPAGDERNPIKARWIEFSPERSVGIHGTADLDSIGKTASHGCVRMKPDDVIELFEQTPKGTPVVVI